MSIQDIIRAWKDADYRESLSEAERALLPAHPAGLIELPDADLGHAAGGVPLTEQQYCTVAWAGFWSCGATACDPGTCNTGCGWVGYCSINAGCHPGP